MCAPPKKKVLLLKVFFLFLLVVLRMSSIAAASWDLTHNGTHTDGYLIDHPFLLIVSGYLLL